MLHLILALSMCKTAELVYIYSDDILSCIDTISYQQCTIYLLYTNTDKYIQSGNYYHGET